MEGGREESRRLRAGELRRRGLERQRRPALRRHRSGDQFLPGGCVRSECRRQQPLRQLDLPGHQQQAQQGAAQREPEVPHGRRCGVPLRRFADHDSAGLFGTGRFQLGFGSEQDRRRRQPEPEAGDVHQLRWQPRVVFHAARPGVRRCLFDGSEGLRRLRYRDPDAVQRADQSARGVPRLRSGQLQRLR